MTDETTVPIRSAQIPALIRALREADGDVEIYTSASDETGDWVNVDCPADEVSTDISPEGEGRSD